jgi:hypothetical protein
MAASQDMGLQAAGSGATDLKQNVTCRAGAPCVVQQSGNVCQTGIVRYKRVCGGLAFSFARLRLHSNAKKTGLSNDFESSFQKPD